jgi:hypothetical protein
LPRSARSAASPSLKRPARTAWYETYARRADRPR